MRGTVYKRKGKYWVDFTHLGDRTRYCVGTDEEEAKAELTKLRREARERELELARRTVFDDSDDPLLHVPLEEVLDRYLAYLRDTARSGSYEHARIQCNHLTSLLGFDFNVVTMVDTDVLRITRQRSAVVQTATVNKMLGTLRTALRYAVSQAGLLKHVPVSVKLLREETPLTQVLSDSQVADLIAEARPPFDLMIHIAVATGFRHSEIRYLWVRDVDFAANRLRVTAKPHPLDPRKRIFAPKNYEERAVPMSDALVDRLLTYVEALDDKSPTAWLLPGLDPVFPRRDTHAPIREAFKTCGLYEGFDKPGLHALRRTWATNALEHTDLVTVMKMGGWKNLKSVQRYLASNEKRMEDAISKQRF